MAFCSAAAAPASSPLSPCLQIVPTPTSNSGPSYFGSLNCIDWGFDALFPSPIPLFVAILSSGVSIDSTFLLLDPKSFLDPCKFSFFVPVNSCNCCVGSSACDHSASCCTPLFKPWKTFHVFPQLPEQPLDQLCIR
jgi:hypothetical protein